MKKIDWNGDIHILAGTTLRDPDVLENNNMALHVGGNVDHVINNRIALCHALDTDLHHCVFAKQTHSDHIHCVTLDDLGKGAYEQESAIDDCDALYTRESNVLLGVFHADCVPVLLYDPIQNIIAAIHSGWQGTVKEITRKTMEHLIAHEQVDPANVIAYIGPAIAYRSFEVGRDVIDQILSMSFDTSGYIAYLSDEKALVNNRGLNKQMLLDAGVPMENITINKSDTFSPNESLFSYRRDHACGRHLSYIIRKDIE